MKYICCFSVTRLLDHLLTGAEKWNPRPPENIDLSKTQNVHNLHDEPPAVPYEK